MLETDGLPVTTVTQLPLSYHRRRDGQTSAGHSERRTLKRLIPGFSCSTVHFESVIETKNYLSMAVSGKKSR